MKSKPDAWPAFKSELDGNRHQSTIEDRGTGLFGGRFRGNGHRIIVAEKMETTRILSMN